MAKLKKVTYSGYKFLGNDSAYEIFSITVKKYFSPWLMRDYVEEKEYIIAAAPYKTEKNIISQRYSDLSLYPMMKKLDIDDTLGLGIQYYLQLMIFQSNNDITVDDKKEYTIDMLEP